MVEQGNVVCSTIVRRVRFCQLVVPISVLYLAFSPKWVLSFDFCSHSIISLSLSTGKRHFKLRLHIIRCHGSMIPSVKLMSMKQGEKAQKRWSNNVWDCMREKVRCVKENIADARDSYLH